MKMKDETLKEIMGKLEKIEAIISSPESIKSKNLKAVDDNSDLLNEYRNNLTAAYKSKSTIKDYLGQAQKLMIFLKEHNLELHLIDKKHLEKYMAQNRKDKRTNTYIKFINCLRSFFNFLSDRDYISRVLIEYLNKLKFPKKIKPIRRSFHDIDLKRVEDYLERKEYRREDLRIRDILIYCLAKNCGLRRQEIINLNWEYIDFINDYLLVKNSKCNKSRLVPFGNKTKEILLSYRKFTRHYKGAVIRGVHGKRITKCSLQNIIMEILKGSGVYRKGETSLHSFRHTAADTLRKNKIDIAVIQAFMGHSDIKTTLEYFHVGNEDLKKAAF
jgi:site-specific recombinase XerD